MCSRVPLKGLSVFDTVAKETINISIWGRGRGAEALLPEIIWPIRNFWAFQESQKIIFSSLKNVHLLKNLGGVGL